MSIRTYREEDALEIAALLRESVTTLAGAFYDADQVAAWAEVLPDAKRIDATRGDGRSTFLYVSNDGDIQAFADIEPDGHIDFLYATPAAAGQGIASQLYDHLENFAIKCDHCRLYTEASEHACRFFLKKGFSQTMRREFEVAGVQLHNFAMEKVLAP